MNRRECLAGTALLLAAAAEPAGAQNKPAPRVVAQGPMSGIQKADRRVVKSQEEWVKLWQEHLKNRPGADLTPPKVDWSKEMLLAVFLGSRPTGGYRIEITEAREDSEKLIVSTREQKPPPGAILIQVITHPFHITAIPRSEKKVEWK